jgi:rhodanese-related sulfurtransferase
MDSEGRFSISARNLYSRLGTATAPIVIDVRRSAAFDADDTMIVGAIRRLPAEVDLWQRELPRGRPVVVYCAHGQEVSQNAAAALRAAEADASYLVLEAGLGRAAADHAIGVDPVHRFLRQHAGPADCRPEEGGLSSSRMPAAVKYSSMKASILWCAGISWRLPPFSCSRTHQRLLAG